MSVKKAKCVHEYAESDDGKVRCVKCGMVKRGRKTKEERPEPLLVARWRPPRCVRCNSLEYRVTATRKTATGRRRYVVCEDCGQRYVQIPERHMDDV